MAATVDLEAQISLARDPRRQPADGAADPGIADDASAERVGFAIVGHPRINRVGAALRKPGGRSGIHATYPLRFPRYGLGVDISGL
jgi:hypothetical protein